MGPYRFVRDLTCLWSMFLIFFCLGYLLSGCTNNFEFASFKQTNTDVKIKKKKQILSTKNMKINVCKFFINTNNYPFYIRVTLACIFFLLHILYLNQVRCIQHQNLDLIFAEVKRNILLIWNFNI